MRREQADHRRRCRGNRTRRDRLLRGDGRDGHGPLRPDAVFVRDFVDYRQQRIDDVPRAGRKGEAIGHERRDDGDVLGVLADDPLGNADEEIDPARHFHRRCSHDDCEDNKGCGHKKAQQGETGCGNSNPPGCGCLRWFCFGFQCFCKPAGDASIHG